MDINFDYDKCLVGYDGVTKLVGLINNKEFEFNVSYGKGFTFDEKGNLTNKEKASIPIEFQEKEFFDKLIEYWTNEEIEDEVVLSSII